MENNVIVFTNGLQIHKYFKNINTIAHKCGLSICEIHKKIPTDEEIAKINMMWGVLDYELHSKYKFFWDIENERLYDNCNYNGRISSYPDKVQKVKDILKEHHQEYLNLTKTIESVKSMLETADDMEKYILCEKRFEVLKEIYEKIHE